MYAVIFLFLVFYDLLEMHVPMGNYWDELTAFAVFCWGIYSLRRNPGMRREERSNWFFLVLLVVIGGLGNVFHPGLQPNPVAWIKDVVALCKFPMIFFILERRSVTEEQQKQIIATAAKISRWIVVVTVLAVIIGRFVDLGFYTGELRLVPAFDFVFSHPTFFISAYVMVAAAMMAESIRRNRIFLWLDCFLVFMAQRTKGYAFIVLFALILILGEERLRHILAVLFGSEKEKAKPFRILLAVAAVGLIFVCVSSSKLQFYLSFGYKSARIAMHLVGMKLLLTFFPLGSGLGTFASYISGEYYSNVYELYGLSGVHGLTKTDYCFVSDVFWPYIYGQFGIFGFLIYLKLVIGIFFRQYRSGISNASRIAMVTVWLYALIASTSEAYFTNGTGVQMALFLTLILGYGSRKTADCDPET